MSFNFCVFGHTSTLTHLQLAHCFAFLVARSACMLIFIAMHVSHMLVQWQLIIIDSITHLAHAFRIHVVSLHVLAHAVLVFHVRSTNIAHQTWWFCMITGIDLMRQLMLQKIRLLLEHFRTNFAQMRIDHIVYTVNVRIEKCEQSKSVWITRQKKNYKIRFNGMWERCEMLLTVVHTDRIWKFCPPQSYGVATCADPAAICYWNALGIRYNRISPRPANACGSCAPWGDVCLVTFSRTHHICKAHKINHLLRFSLVYHWNIYKIL